MKRVYDMLIEKDSAGHLVASVPTLPGCHTQAKSLDKLQVRIREAIELCLEESGPKAEPSEIIGIQRVAVEA